MKTFKVCGQVFVFLGALVALSSCNAFAPFDGAGSDDQHLSAARACFDSGDYACAKEHYGKMSASRADDAHSDEALLILDENGASMANFMSTIGIGGGDMGTKITKLAAKLTNSGGSAGQTKRLAILSAYQKSALISDAKLKGLVKFLSSVALFAEILAEHSTVAGYVKQNDIVTNSTTCKAAAGLACAVTAGCDGPFDFLGGSPTLSLMNNADFTGTLNYDMLNAALVEIGQGLSEVSGNSALGTDINDLATAIKDAGALAPRCFRQTLLNKNIGTN